MARISKRFSQISESQTVALSSIMARLKKEGKDVVALGAGEPDFDTPNHIKEAAVDAIHLGFTKYTPAEGTIELREEIAHWLQSEYQANFKLSELIVTCGAKHAVYQAILSICDPGDEVLLPVPYWVSYPEQIKLSGAGVKLLSTTQDNGLKITAAQLSAAITTNTRLLILNSPSNPSGAVYSNSELDEITNVIRDSGIYVLSDEIYDRIVFDDSPFTSLLSYPEIREQLLYVNGVSKSFAMTGWRIGFLAANEQIITAIKKYQGHSTSNPTSISQKAALAAYRGEKDFLKEMRKAFQERRDYVLKRLLNIHGVQCTFPHGAFYAFPNISYYFGREYNGKQILSSNDLCAYLLEHFGVAVVPGDAFGMDAHVRLSYATSMDILKKALDRIEDGLVSLL